MQLRNEERRFYAIMKNMLIFSQQLSTKALALIDCQEEDVYDHAKEDPLFLPPDINTSEAWRDCAGAIEAACEELNLEGINDKPILIKGSLLG